MQVQVRNCCIMRTTSSCYTASHSEDRHAFSAYLRMGNACAFFFAFVVFSVFCTTKRPCFRPASHADMLPPQVCYGCMQQAHTNRVQPQSLHDCQYHLSAAYSHYANRCCASYVLITRCNAAYICITDMKTTAHA